MAENYSLVVNQNGTNTYQTPTGAQHSTVAVYGYFSQQVKLKSITVLTNGGTWVYTGAEHSIFVMSQSGTIIRYENAAGKGASTGPGWKIDFSEPPVLEAGVYYHIGIYNPNTNAGGYSNYPRVTTAIGSAAIDSSPTGITWNSNNYTYYINNQTSLVVPNQVSTAYTPSFAFGLDLGNSAPTAIITQPENSGFLNTNTSSANVSWGYVDSSDAQTEYEVSYRVKGSTGSYTTVGNTGSATSHTFSTGTFTDGEEYELRVRVKDAVMGWGNYSTVYFTGGPSAWVYDAPVASSTASGSFPSNIQLQTYGTFENSTDVANGQWGSNGAFGAYVTATVARTSSKAATGTYSLEVTCPTSTTRTWANCVVPVEPGQLYEVSADVWIPTGMPPAEIDCVFREIVSQKSTLFDQWQTIKAWFTCDATDAFVGVRVEGATTSTQKYWIDNFTVKRAYPEMIGGQYEAQVRTTSLSATATASPWSASANFTVNTSGIASAVDVNPKTIGGNVNVTWSYSDPESNPQTKYQVRHRQA